MNFVQFKMRTLLGSIVYEFFEDFSIALNMSRAHFDKVKEMKKLLVDESKKSVSTDLYLNVLNLHLSYYTRMRLSSK